MDLIPKTTISIADRFSRAPAGRYPTDGPHCGQNFRDNVLVPSLREANTVEIVLDGVDGFGSSFLEETFGGLLRHYPINEAEFRRRITLVATEDPTLIDEIYGYVADEEKRQRASR